MKRILSPLLYHTNGTIATQAQQAILPTQADGMWSPESRENFCGYQLQYLEEKLCPFGIVLQQHWTLDSNLVTYIGDLHYNQQRIQRVTCRATAPYGPTASAFEVADKALTRIIDVMEALHDKDQQISSHFVHILLHNQKGTQKFYVSNQDWKLQTLSEVLLADLRRERQKITLEDKKKLVEFIIRATHFAHEKGILLRSFVAESFTAQETCRGLYVTFSDMDSARRAHDRPELKFIGI